MLRAYLERLPGFKDVIRLDEALPLAVAYGSIYVLYDVSWSGPWIWSQIASALNLARVRALLQPAPPPTAQDDAEAQVAVPPRTCPCCGGRMLLIEIFERGSAPRSAPIRTFIWIDTS